MKYILILGDGMADEPIEVLGNKTPLEVAKTPMMDYLAGLGEVGMVQTVPEGLKPGSEVANLSVLGYNPLKCYTGRSPLEAISIGVDMKETDVCYRINLVTLSEDEPYDEKSIIDHSAEEITTEEGRQLMDAISTHFGTEELTFYKGVSYRHALIWDNGSTNVELTPPHDILGRKVTDYLPKGDHYEYFRKLMKASYEVLNEHPVNVERRKKGLRVANSIWPWGEGTKPELESFEDKHGKKASMISAVDLLKGIAIGAKVNSIDVEGANGGLHTNYKGKVEAAINALESGDDFVYVHIEAPDECGHRGEMDNKIKAIEAIDEQVIKPIFNHFKGTGEAFRMTVLPDHPTPLVYRTHTSNPVPFIIYDSTKELTGQLAYTEESASKGRLIEEGYRFMTYFLQEDTTC